jgi:hypothetical protein
MAGSGSSACTPILLSQLSTPATFRSWSQGYVASLNILAGLTTTPSTTQQTNLIQATTDIASFNRKKFVLRNF